VSTLAIDIGGTKFSAALFETPQPGSPRMIRREWRETDRNGGREWMVTQVEILLREWARDARIERCGIGFGGPVNYARQRVALSTHVGGWRDFPLTEHIRNLLGVPVVMDNDANAAALGEACYGAGRESRPLFYMTLSTGVGGGLILENGELYRGADSYAGEIGHLTVQPDGPDCLCGSRGCLERMCAGLWLQRDHRKSPKELFGDPVFVREYVVNLALGLKAAIMLLNPMRVVIGGGISKAGDALFVPLREELGRIMTAWSRARLDVVPAALGDDSVLWGALALAKREVS